MLLINAKIFFTEIDKQRGIYAKIMMFWWYLWLHSDVYKALANKNAILGFAF